MSHRQPGRPWRPRTPEERRQASRVQDRRKRGALGYDGVTDERIYRRDKWRCRMPVCLHAGEAGNEDRAIDPELLGTGDQWAPSIDHIVPLAEGGRDDARNKRASHARCNNYANEEGQREPDPEPALRSGDLPMTVPLGDLVRVRGGRVFATIEEMRAAWFAEEDD